MAVPKDEITPDEQINVWVEGISIHNDKRYYNFSDKNSRIVTKEKMIGGECCPDFSCCNPNLLWPKYDRIRFKNATEPIRMQMLFTSLISLIRREKKFEEVRIHTTGQAHKERSH